MDPPALAAFLERIAADVAPGDRRGATLRIVSDRSIRELNRRYRDRDRATDVLAFPADPVPAGLLSEEEAAYLGDLVVSAETAARQAREAGVELGDEIRVLAVHGYLHLLGYDHERDRGEMVRLERVLRLRHGLLRELIMFLWILLLLVAGLLVVLFALFEIAFFASSPIAVRALGESVEEARTLRERLADPLVVLIPARSGAPGRRCALRLRARPAGVRGDRPPVDLRRVRPRVVHPPGTGSGRHPPAGSRGCAAAAPPWFGRWERLVRPLGEPLRNLLRRGFPLPSEPDDEASDEEVEAFLETGEEEGILEEEEAAMVRGVLELDEMLVREVMTPRPSVVSVSGEASRQEVERLVAESRHHRIPVFGAADQVVGVVDAVDLVAVPGGGAGLAPLLREVPVVPETKRVDDLLREFKLSKQTFAVVVDEHASVSGIVTLRDISEEIVGEVHEEDEPFEENLAREADGVYRVRGGAELDEVARLTGLTLPDSLNGAAFDTISGFALAAFRRIPAAGEAMEQDGLRIEILEADERRIHRVRLTRVADG